MSDPEKAPEIMMSALHKHHSAFLVAWGFDSISSTVPAYGIRKNPFAVWHGMYGVRDEAPVLAVEIKGFFSSPDAWPDWYYGIASRSEIDADADQNAAMLRTALYPARTIHEALGVLACMAPLSQCRKPPVV